MFVRRLVILPSALVVCASSALLAQQSPPSGPMDSGASLAKQSREAIAVAFEASAPAVELGVVVDTAVVPVTGKPGTHVQIASEIRHQGRPVKAVGYRIVDEQGATAIDTVDTPPMLRYVDDARVMYLMTEPLAPGKYRMKIAALDEDGRRGVAEHAFEVRPWAAIETRVSDLLLGDNFRGVFRPSAHRDPTTARLGARLEVHTTSADAFFSMSVEMTVTPRGAAAPIVRETVPLVVTIGRLQRTCTAWFDTSTYAPGEYVLTAVVKGAAGEIDRRERVVRIKS